MAAANREAGYDHLLETPDSISSIVIRDLRHYCHIFYNYIYGAVAVFLIRCRRLTFPVGNCGN